MLAPDFRFSILWADEGGAHEFAGGLEEYRGYLAAARRRGPAPPLPRWTARDGRSEVVLGYTTRHGEERRNFTCSWTSTRTSGRRGSSPRARWPFVCSATPSHAMRSRTSSSATSWYREATSSSSACRRPTTTRRSSRTRSSSNLRRSPNRHVGFSAGVDYCLGAALARIELQLALAGILVEVAVDRAGRRGALEALVHHSRPREPAAPAGRRAQRPRIASAAARPSAMACATRRGTTASPIAWTFAAAGSSTPRDAASARRRRRRRPPARAPPRRTADAVRRRPRRRTRREPGTSGSRAARPAAAGRAGSCSRAGSRSRTLPTASAPPPARRPPGARARRR